MNTNQIIETTEANKIFQQIIATESHRINMNCEDGELPTLLSESGLYEFQEEDDNNTTAVCYIKKIA